MGWHVGLSYEEMQQQFGEEQQQQQQQPENVETTETKTDSNNDDNDCGGTTSNTTDTDGVGVDEEAVDPTTITTATATISATAASTVGCPLPFNDHDSSLLVLQPPPKEYKSIYHLCRYNDWNDCLDTSVSTGSTDNNNNNNSSNSNSTDSTGTEAEQEQEQRNYKPYFSRTYLKDGKFIRASLHKNDMITVANEYYKDSSPPNEKWIILEINPHYLYYNMGIPILANVTAPESYSKNSSRNNGNNTNTNTNTKPEIKCLQIFGGLSTNPITISKLITNIYPIHRQLTISTSTSTENVGKFISIGSSTSTSAAAAVQVVPEQPKQQSTTTTTTTTTTTGKTTTNNDGKKEKKKKKKKKSFGGLQLLRKMIGVGRFEIIKGRD